MLESEFSNTVQYANMLYIESPVGVGFSYNADDPSAYTVGDDLSARKYAACCTQSNAGIQLSGNQASAVWQANAKRFTSCRIRVPHEMTSQKL